MSAYSFLDFQASLIGPGGAVSLGSGAGAAEEGVSIEAVEPTNTMTIGADGTAMHSLHASKASKIVVHLMKTSPTNAALQAMYNFQRTSGLSHGQNTLVMTQIVGGDVYANQKVAFAKLPGNLFAKDARMIDWEFDCGQTDAVLGMYL
jgi:hypothetical protein